MEPQNLETWEHKTGCPVVIEPTEENQTRVETYVAVNHRTGERKRVTRCVTCGAANYVPIDENGDPE